MKHAKVFGGAVLGLGTLVASAGACGDGDGAEDLTPDATSSVSSSSGDATTLPPEPDAGFQGCATDTYGGDLLPLELTVLFDTSSSLCFVQDTPDAGSDAGDDDAGTDAGVADAGEDDAGDASAPSIYDNGHFDCTDSRSRWPATSSAMRSFLSSADTAGLTVAVRTFGPVDSWTPPSVETNRCDPGQYATPDFEATDLPSQSFANRIAGISVKTAHPDATQTQTAAVIAGGTTYMKARKEALAGSKGVAMVLVTDGNPEGCDPTLAVPNYATEVDKQYAYGAATNALAQGIKLYVLNTGGTKDVLDTIASRGGTGEAITIDDPTDPGAILGALETIRRKALTCEMQLPTPPSGTPDFAKLALAWSPEGSGGTASSLPYDTACSDPRGWHYDDANAPKRIELCPGICSDVTTSETGKMSIVLGCKEAPPQ